MTRGELVDLSAVVAAGATFHLTRGATMAAPNLSDQVARRTPGPLLRRLNRRMSAVIAARFEESQLSYMQWVALKLVADGMVATIGGLARELGVTAGATTRMVDTLAAHGLMQRSRRPADRRVVCLRTTTAGESAVTALRGRAVAAWNELFAELGQGEADRLIELVDHLVVTAERMSRSGAAASATRAAS